MDHKKEEKTVLITGASGFIGSTIAQKLANEGYKVKCLLRRASSTKFLSQVNYERVDGDVTDIESLKEAVKNVDVIYHIAGVVSAHSKVGFYKVNYEGAKNLAEAILEKGNNVSLVVNVSSLASGGPSTVLKAKTEDEADRPVSWYGQSKLYGERELFEKLKDKVKVISIRPPAVMGPYDKGMFFFFQMLKYRLSPKLKMKELSFIDVDDLTNGMVNILTNDFSKIETGVYYFSYDKKYSLEEFLQIMCNSMNVDPLITIPVPYRLATLVGMFMDFLANTFGINTQVTQDKIRELSVEAWTCSNEKAKNKLGFTPKISLEESSKRTYDWYVENNWL